MWVGWWLDGSAKIPGGGELARGHWGGVDPPTQYHSAMAWPLLVFCFCCAVSYFHGRRAATDDAITTTASATVPDVRPEAGNAEVACKGLQCSL